MTLVRAAAWGRRAALSADADAEGNVGANGGLCGDAGADGNVGARGIRPPLRWTSTEEAAGAVAGRAQLGGPSNP